MAAGLADDADIEIEQGGCEFVKAPRQALGAVRRMAIECRPNRRQPSGERDDAQQPQRGGERPRGPDHAAMGHAWRV